MTSKEYALCSFFIQVKTKQNDRLYILELAQGCDENINQNHTKF